MTQNSIVTTIAEQINAHASQIQTAIDLLDSGSTVPFIARYRKEATKGLDDTQLRQLEQKLGYLRELESRRTTILDSIASQGKLTDALKQQINTSQSKTELEDLYLPFRPKRRTKGQIAIEAGLEPLADQLWNDPSLDPNQHAETFINISNNINDSRSALEGARAILMERFAENASVLQKMRTHLSQHADLVSKVVDKTVAEAEKFQDYFEHRESLKNVPSHRALAMFRGRKAGILQLSLDIDHDSHEPVGPLLIGEVLGFRHQNRAADDWLQQVFNWTWKIKVLMHLETELLSQLREQAETEAIRVFAKNLKDLLMAAPAGHQATLAIDPGLRTGCKIAVIDPTGKVLATDTIYPHPPQKQQNASIATLLNYLSKFNISLIAIGNGTASRETERLVKLLLKENAALQCQPVVVSEAGASVYSASELAAKEHPELDVSLRGAVSIARRLQDPLAELVKIDPKAIGVGQYQHDVNQTQLARQLDIVVEDCVNAVGVDLNTASAALLTHVAGLSQQLAQNIIEHRETIGQFNNRKQLKDVKRLGPKAFEQCAGFLRISNGDNPLDASAVHPEAYAVVKSILKETKCSITELFKQPEKIRQLDATQYTNESFGLPTVKDILKELEKPGRDPRPEFKTASFQEGIEKISDLVTGMQLEGVVTNVTNFGAFVDIGVHQDGLVHISALADRYVSDPHEVVKTGDIVRVSVLDVDEKRKRIALSCKTEDQGRSQKHSHSKPHHQAAKKPQPATINNAFADAFSKAMKK